MRGNEGDHPGDLRSRAWDPEVHFTDGPGPEAKRRKVHKKAWLVGGSLELVEAFGTRKGKGKGKEGDATICAKKRRARWMGRCNAGLAG